MRVLMTVQPGYGHLHPLVPLARALLDLGHDVRVGTSSSFAPAVGAAGLIPVPVGVNWTMSAATTTFPELREHSGVAGKAFMLSTIFCERTAAATACDVISLARSWRPDLLVRETWELGGGIAARVLKVPCGVYGIGPY